MKQDGWGRRRHWLPRNFCRLLGLGCPKQAFAKIAALSTNYRKRSADAIAVSAIALIAFFSNNTFFSA
jgi:hypothetical protein